MALWDSLDGLGGSKVVDREHKMYKYDSVHDVPVLDTTAPTTTYTPTIATIRQHVMSAAVYLSLLDNCQR